MQLPGVANPVAVKAANLRPVDVRVPSAEELCQAVAAAQLSTIESLLEVGVDINELVNAGPGLEAMRTPLMTAVVLAAESNDKRPLLALLRSLTVALRKEDARPELDLGLDEMAAEMQRRAEGAKPAAGRDARAETAFHWCCEWDHHELALQLISIGGVDINAGQGMMHGTGLMAAAKEGALATVRCLLQNGAVVDAGGGPDGCTAFHFACAAGHTSCVAALIAAGANIALGTGRGGFTGAQMAEQLQHTAVLELIQRISAGGKVSDAEMGGPLEPVDLGASVGAEPEPDKWTDSEAAAASMAEQNREKRAERIDAAPGPSEEDVAAAAREALRAMPGEEGKGAATGKEEILAMLRAKMEAAGAQ